MGNFLHFWTPCLQLNLFIPSNIEKSLQTVPRAKKKKKPNSIQELKTPCLNQESKSNLLTEMFEIAWIQKKQILDSEYGFRPRYDPSETCFVGTHQPFTGTEHTSRIENKIYIYTHTDCRLRTLNSDSLNGSDTAWGEWGLWFELQRCTKNIHAFLKLARFENRLNFKTHVRSFVKIKMTYAVLLCQVSRVAIRFEQGSLVSQNERGTY